MSRILFLDSGPLGLLTPSPAKCRSDRGGCWLSQCLLNESRVIVPAIVYYEVRCELLRANKPVGLAGLDAFLTTNPGRYLPLSDRALRLAAELWAKARQDGQPTADAKALDTDVIIAAQALSFGLGGTGVTVVTTNPRHLSQFAAKNWPDIVP